MKRTIIILLSFIAIANIAKAEVATCSGFPQSIKLSSKQACKIEAIEKEYIAKMGALNGDIILRKMEIAQLKSYSPQSSKIIRLNFELENINNELAELKNEKRKEILSNLGIIQRFKYKKYCK